MKSNFNEVRVGDEINLERCMLMNGRIDGHIVQGHVDASAVCIDKKDLNGSWEYRFNFSEEFAKLRYRKRFNRN